MFEARPVCIQVWKNYIFRSEIGPGLESRVEDPTKNSEEYRSTAGIRSLLLLYTK